MSDMSTFDAGDQQVEGSDLPLWSYRSGSWYSVFGPEVAVLLPAAQKEYVAALWALVDGGAAFDDVLDALLASGLSRLPGFVIVSTGTGPTRVLVRGAGVTARVTTAAGPESDVVIDGAAGGTWSERTVDGVTALVVEVEDSSDQAADFPIPAGLVRVARIDRPAATPETPEITPKTPAITPETPDVTGQDDVPPAQPEPETEAETELIEVPADLTEHDPEPIPESEPQPEPQPASAPVVEPPPAVPEPSPMDNDGWTEPTFASDPLSGPLAQATEGAAEPPPGWVVPPSAPVPPLDGDTLAPAPLPPPPIGAPPSAPPPPLPGGWAAGAPPLPPGASPVAKLLVSDGQTVLVDKIVLIGRAPEARRFSVTEQPQLVTVPSRLHEISSTHIEVRPGTGADQGTAVVTDMGSTNGTVLVQPGLGPEDLKPGIAVPLVPGAVINLGDGITIQVTRP